MIENKPDKEATKALRKAGVFQEYKSFVSYAGHIYLVGKDRSRRREQVFEAQKHCQLCKKELRGNDGEMDHKAGGRPVARCDCWRTRLADGTMHTNVQRVCSQFSREWCHLKKHHRDLRWTPR